MFSKLWEQNVDSCLISENDWWENNSIITFDYFNEKLLFPCDVIHSNQASKTFHAQHLAPCKVKILYKTWNYEHPRLNTRVLSKSWGKIFKDGLRDSPAANLEALIPLSEAASVTNCSSEAVANPMVLSVSVHKRHKDICNTSEKCEGFFVSLFSSMPQKKWISLTACLITC